jgi:hypothetical protein
MLLAVTNVPVIIAIVATSERLCELSFVAALNPATRVADPAILLIEWIPDIRRGNII